MIRVTTTGHDYITGDRVSILEVAGQHNLGNKIWTVTKVDSKSFDLQGSTYAGPYAVTSSSAALQEAQLPQTGNVVARNYIHNCDPGSGGIWWDSATTYSDNTVQIYDNIVANCTGYGIILVRPQGGSTCYNNQIYNCDNGIAMHSTSGYTVNNNIVANVNGVYVDYQESCDFTGTTNSVDYNCYYPGNIFGYSSPIEGLSNGTFAQWKSLSPTGGPWDAHSITSNPLNTNQSGAFSLALDFQLQSSSPCVNAGKNVGLTADFWNNPIPAPPSPLTWA